MSTEVKTKWYNKRALLFLSCWLFFPLGLYGVWKSSEVAKRWKYVITALILILYVPYIFILLNGDAQAPQKISSSPPQKLKKEQNIPIPDYSIIKIHNMAPYKISYDLLIHEELSKAQLERIRSSILEQTQDEYEKTFIVFYLPGMEVDAGGWAIGHSDREVEIFGR